MKKLNQFLRLTVLVFLFTLPFLLIGCTETQREMMFSDIDIPESATVMIQDVPVGAEFDLTISTDFITHNDNFGKTVVIHHDEMEYTVTQEFSKTFMFSDVPRISIKLNCTVFESEDEINTDSIRLIVQFKGDGDFTRGDVNKVFPVKLGTSIHMRRSFSH